MSESLGALAVRFGCELRGDPDARVERVATLSGAQPGALGFLANKHYRDQLRQTRATAVVLDAGSAADCPVAALVSRNPYATYARIAQLLHPAAAVQPGIHPAAVVDASAVVDPGAQVAATAVIGPQCRIGPGVYVGSGCVLADGVELAQGCRLIAHVTLGPRVRIGARSIIQPGAVIGADGFGFANENRAWVKVPQVGSVRIGPDVEVGANTTIDRGAIEDTVLEEGVKLDNQIQIAHNVHIGAHTVMAACSGISGSTRIGARCVMAGMVGVAGHIEICDDVVITGFTMVTHSITEPGMYSGALSLEPTRRWRRLAGRFKRLDVLNSRVQKLEKKLGVESTADQEASDD
ncbi:MAG TPA: UDP-3-O-(3-hydroxymyristoyl)glucosamine N-acyltransferase [Steroidobacteraceae bacterium]|nr:UDP-3-O-(3-hydroxymyristoyl)glucosamine N-acyltransferase [Steroidobacteraceae bacterium]